MKDVLGNEVVDNSGAEIHLTENGHKEKTRSQQCMDEIQEALIKYNCRPVCVPEEFYGQKVMVWAVQEIKNG